MVKEGKFTYQHLKIIDNILEVQSGFKKGKSDFHAADNLRKNATSLINNLIEYSQRKELVEFDKRRMILKYKENNTEKTAEILVCDKEAFLFKEGKIKKITNKIEESNMDEVTKAMEQQKIKRSANISSEIFSLLKKELGDFEISL